MSLTVLIVFACALLAVIIAAAAVIRESRSLAIWSFAAGMTLLAAGAACTALSLRALTAGEALSWQENRLLVLSFGPGTWLLFSLTYSRGNYREFLIRWKYAILAAFLIPVVMAFANASKLLTLAESAGGVPAFRLLPAGKLVMGAWLLASVGVLMNLERTFTASIGTMRWRIKFMVIGLGLFFAFHIYSASQSLLYSMVTLPMVTLNALVLGTCSLLLAVALLRSRVSEIEIYPSQAVLQGSVTVLLAGLYLFIMGIIAKFIGTLGESVNFPLQAFIISVAIALLGVLLLSDRLQQRARLLVSRHFRRPHYDYRSVWSKFTERTSSLVDKTQFSRAVARFISETFNCLSVNIWLLDEQQARLSFAASTLMAENAAGSALHKHAGTQRLIEGLRRCPGPMDIETAKAEWVADLRQWNPDFFEKGSPRICIPLVSAGELLGIIIVGDRVAGVKFSLEDMDLMKCLGDQVAGALRNLELSDQITRAREVEAFQAMSTFMVHDLKNLAYGLTIMLQNMKQHFDNPEFRADAMKGLARNVEHLNDLISRFSLLRQGLAMNLAEGDLNAVVKECVATLPSTASIKILVELQDLPKIAMDPGQIQKVITNLIINARDAVGAAGEVRVRTARQNGWVVLSVSDTGCGMTPEFMQNQLFKPFQSTKKNGLGIGMYHCKTIVTAHRGRIEVDSTPRQGTTFNVLLPVPHSAS